MSSLSTQQEDVVALPLTPFCVSACAGSGKTRTAVNRLHRMRELLGDAHGTVALLSFSNVAVNTFRRDYFALAKSSRHGAKSSKIEIDTVDGFLTANIIRPHAHRVMGCKRVPFLVSGMEPFLKGFKVFDGTRSHDIGQLNARLTPSGFEFNCDVGYTSTPIQSSNALKSINKLGAVGAYTHSLGRFWAIRTLEERDFVLRALTRRYPHILVDEAQDIGPEHQAILEMLTKSGAQLSLIGDPHQGIYEFSGANGKFLRSYGGRKGVSSCDLTINYRSVPRILNVANRLSRRSDSAARTSPSTMNGAYYIPYNKGEKDKLLAAYESMLMSARILTKDAAIVCRSTNWVEDWRDGSGVQGQGVVKLFVEAVILRDKLGRLYEAFERTCKGVIGLLAAGHGDLATVLIRGVPRATAVPVRRAIWSFVRNSDVGLPAGNLPARSEWHPLLKSRVAELLQLLQRQFSYALGDNIGQKLASKALSDRPIVDFPDLAHGTGELTNVSTVHQVKGESIDAVMYVADRGQIREMLDGTDTELGRIGYVALTRARNLFVLAVPESCIGDFESELVASGFQKGSVSTSIAQKTQELQDKHVLGVSELRPSDRWRR